MKVKASLKLACKDCFYVRRGKNLYIRCTTNPRHKRRQGFSTLNYRPESGVLLSNFSLHTLPSESHELHGSHCHHCQKPIEPL